MNLNTIQSLLSVALNEAQEPWIGTATTLVNEALNQIQQRRSFNCNKLTIPFVLNITGAAPYTYALPLTFKELQSGPYPLRNTNQPAYLGTHWRIFTRQQVNELTFTGVGVADRTAFIEQDASGQWSIYFPGPLDVGILPVMTNFEVDTYSYLPPVVNPTDENDLMRKYPMLVLEYAKMLVFSLGSDEDSKAAKQESMRMIDGTPGFTGYFARASADDNSHTVRGRTSRMNGF